MLVHSLPAFLKARRLIKDCIGHAFRHRWVIGCDLVLMWVHACNDAGQAWATKTGSHVAASKRQTVLSQSIDVGRLNNFVPHECVVCPRVIIGNDHDHIGAIVCVDWEQPYAQNASRKESGKCFQSKSLQGSKRRFRRTPDASDGTGSYGNPGRFCFGVGFRGIADRQAQRVLGLWVHKEPADRTR